MSLLKRLTAALLGLGDAPEDSADRTHAVARLEGEFGVRVAESHPKGGARRLRVAELDLVAETLALLGPRFYGPFRADPIRLWVDINPGGGGYGHKALRIGEPGADLSQLYRVFLHEATHASNEYRGWPYERKWCTLPGLDWREGAGGWTHPRQQGRSMQPGAWETLPVSARDVSTAPGEDLAEAVRYYVHSVKDERAYLWPLDLRQPPLYLWDTSPTRFVLVRDHFLGLPERHPWYRRLTPEQEARAAANLSGLAPA